MYQINLSYDKSFSELLSDLAIKYKKEIFEIEGIGSQLDIAKFSKKYFSNLQDSSIDNNANVAQNTIITYKKEASKPLYKLNSLYILWKLLRKDYGTAIANEIIEKQINGALYIHDLWLIQTFYCFNYSCIDIVNKGLPMISAIKSVAPKYLYSFKSQLEQFIIIATNSSLGASSTADLLLCMSYYFENIKKRGNDAGIYFDGWMSDEDKLKTEPFLDRLDEIHKLMKFNVINNEEYKNHELLVEIENIENEIYNTINRTSPSNEKWFRRNYLRYLKETLISLVYTLNQPMRGDQSAFTNISIYDKYFIEDSRDMYIFPDLTQPSIENVNILQDMFLTIMNEELSRTVFTFPVTTACFSIDKTNEIQDIDFANFIAYHNRKFGFINIFIGESSVHSSCCFTKDTKVTCKSSNYGVFYDTFENIYQLNHKEYKKAFTILHNGSWSKGKIVKIKKDKKSIYKIITFNNKELYVTDDHINCTLEGDKKTIDLSIDDYLLFNTRAVDTFPEKDMKLTYEQGYFLGMYLGDGSKYKKKNNNSYSTTLSLSINKIDTINIIKKALEDWNIEREIHINETKNNVIFINIFGKELFNIINLYIKGDYSYEKELNLDILLQSKDFRKGILDGWYKTDGGNSNRIYTTSKKLAEHGELLLTSLGINSIIDISDRTGEGVVMIRDEIANRNYPVYCLRWYDMKNKRSMGEVYKVRNNSEYFKIKSIEKINNNDEYVYCFEMDNEDEPYFTLPNGIITHNCRLKSDGKNEYLNTIGGSSTKIGSLGCVTINMPRIAYESENIEDFYNRLNHEIRNTGRINNARRKMIQRKIDEGYMPLYTHGFVDIGKQYSTTGINGMYEAMLELGYDISNDIGLEFAENLSLFISEHVDALQKIDNKPHNCEIVPGESCSVKNAEKDRLLGLNNHYKIYSNQFYPLVADIDLLDRIKIQGKLDNKFSGGNIMHVNIENETSVPDMVTLIKLCAVKGVRYFGINYNIQLCENGHITTGKNEICKICGAKITDNFTRIVGFLVNKNLFNKTRQEIDYPNRKFYKET